MRLSRELNASRKQSSSTVGREFSSLSSSAEAQRFVDPLQANCHAELCSSQAALGSGFLSTVSWVSDPIE